jgi:hypothetical protein
MKDAICIEKYFQHLAMVRGGRITREDWVRIGRERESINRV